MNRVFAAIAQPALILAVASYFSCTGDAPAAGATSETTNGVVATIVDSTGTGVSGVPVALVPWDFNPVTGNGGLTKAAYGSAVASTSDTSDDAGQVALFGLTEGVYNLIGTSAEYQCRLLVTSISLAADDDTVALDTIPLTRPGAVLVNIDSSHYGAGNSLVLRGTGVVLPVTHPGVILMQAPAGLLDIRYVDAAGNPVTGWPVSDSVTVLQGDTADVTNIAETVSVPSAPRGETTGTTIATLWFSTGNAVSNKGAPVQYQFDWGLQRYSTWSADTMASFVWQTAGTYSIRAQARSARDTSVVSGWSQSFAVSVQ